MNQDRLSFWLQLIFDSVSFISLLMVLELVELTHFIKHHSYANGLRIPEIVKLILDKNIRFSHA